MAVPALFALLAGWSALDNMLAPNFAGDQGVRLDRAGDVVVGVGERVWLPFLQLHLVVLHALHAPVGLYLVVPWLYLSAFLVALAALARAALPRRREALAASTLLALAVIAGPFSWLGRSLYQEVIVLPLFVALVVFHHFAPRRWSLTLALLGVGMLTREIFWIWWLAFGAVAWRGMGSVRRAATASLGVVPLMWIALTRQPVTLGRNRAEEVEILVGLPARVASLLQLVVEESLLVALILIALVFGIVAWRRTPRALGFRRYHAFSFLSLTAFYGYVVLFDPWRATPDNPRQLVPLYAHLLVAAVLAWREAAQLDGRAGALGRTLVAAALLSTVQLGAIRAAVAGTPPRATAGWEPARLATAVPRDSWRRTLSEVAAARRASSHGALHVVFVEMPASEYRKFFVAPLLYDRRTRVDAIRVPADADLVVAPAGTPAPIGWAAAGSLQLRADSVWSLWLPANDP